LVVREEVSAESWRLHDGVSRRVPGRIVRERGRVRAQARGHAARGRRGPQDRGGTSQPEWTAAPPATRTDTRTRPASLGRAQKAMLEAFSNRKGRRETVRPRPGGLAVESDAGRDIGPATPSRRDARCVRGPGTASARRLSATWCGRGESRGALQARGPAVGDVVAVKLPGSLRGGGDPGGRPGCAGRVMMPGGG